MDKRVELKLSSSVNDLGEGEIRAIVASEDTDRYGEVLEMAGLDTTNYMKNPVVQFGHNYDQPPVAKTLELIKEGKNLIAKLKFAVSENPFANMIYQMYKNGYMSAFSIGFMPTDSVEQNGILHYTASEMLEFSAVPIPANPKALLLAKTFGFDDDMVNKTFIQKQGKVLSAKNRSIIEGARKALDDVLGIEVSDTSSSEEKSIETKISRTEIGSNGIVEKSIEEKVNEKITEINEDEKIVEDEEIETNETTKIPETTELEGETIEKSGCGGKKKKIIKLIVK